MSKYTEVDVANDYWYFVQQWMLFLDKNSDIPGFGTTAISIYGYDERRTEYHNRLCEAMGLSKEQTKEITDNIDHFDCFEAFYEALAKLKEQHK